MNELVRQETNVSQIERLSEELQVDPQLKAYICFIVELCDPEEPLHAYTAKDQTMLKFAALNIIEETIGMEGKGFACEMTYSYMMGIVAFPSMSSQSKYERQSLELGQAISSNIKKYLKRKCNICFNESAFGWSTWRPVTV